ncbi:MAG: hypothetical protein GY829_16150, partial [Gammaproteobacteria bacterium]|nr:hypothetical protein [Gammaproteobacteria bacterium]
MTNICPGIFKKAFANIIGGIYMFQYKSDPDWPYSRMGKKIINNTITEDVAAPNAAIGRSTGHYLDLNSMDGYRFDTFLSEDGDTLFTRQSSDGDMRRLMVNGGYFQGISGNYFDGFSAFNDGSADYGYLLQSEIINPGDEFTFSVSINRFDFNEDAISIRVPAATLTPLDTLTFTVPPCVDLEMFG